MRVARDCQGRPLPLIWAALLVPRTGIVAAALGLPFAVAALIRTAF